ncbi:MAG TPA: site-2 protease family protein [Kofleriaceae bacterium]|nr:site-2 protease family protein [Kofleriaceae bacterium]
MFQDGSLTLFRIRGVPVRAHWTLLLVLPYLALVLSIQFRAVAELADVPRDQLVLPPLIWGLVLAIGLFVSITLHELAHSIVALRFGGRVRSITLMLLGGVSQLARIPRRPYHEGLMALVGPVTSLVLGVLLYLAYAASATWPADAQMALFYLAGMNLTLGVFNLVPAFPMDGGRLLRAALAARLSRARATQIAAAIGKVCAVAFGLLGLWSANLLLILVAVFVYAGAQAELERERIRDALEGLRIVDLLPQLKRPPPIVSAERLVGEVLPRMRELDRLELVVVDPSGAPLTVLQASDLASVSTGARWAVTIGELAAQLPVRHIVVPWGSSANDAIERAAEAEAAYVIVVDPGAEPPDDLVGLVAAEDIARMVKLQLLARQAGPNPPRSASLAA